MRLRNTDFGLKCAHIHFTFRKGAGDEQAIGVRKRFQKRGDIACLGLQFLDIEWF